MKREPTFEEITVLWKKEKCEKVKPTTLAAYSLSLNKYLLPYFNWPSEVNEKSIGEFINAKKNAGLSSKSIRDILTVLKMVMTFAQKNKFIPEREIKFTMPKDNIPKGVVVFSPSQQQALMTYLIKNATSRNLGILLCLQTGIRIGELCALKWEDINLEIGIVTIHKTMYRIYQSDKGLHPTSLITSTPKTMNSCRSIPLPDSLLALMRSMRPKNYEGKYLISGSQFPIEPRTYRNYYHKLLKELKFPALKFHTLRHTFATRCIESDCDCKTVSAILGHADVSTTLNLYMHPSHAQKKKCIEKMLSSLK